MKDPLSKMNERVNTMPIQYFKQRNEKEQQNNLRMIKKNLFSTLLLKGFIVFIKHLLLDTF